MQKLAQEEELSVTSGEGPLRSCSEPPYTGGDPETQWIEVNLGVKEGRFSLWRDLWAMYTRIEIVYE